MDVGLSVVSRMDLRGAAHDRMEALAHRTGETVHLARLELPNVLFVDCVESSKAIRVASRVGHVLPAHCTSVGKAMLAAGGEDLQDYFAGQPLPTVTSQSISSHSKLEQELAAVREQGFATSSGESEDGVGSVGVAVVDRLDRVVGGISIAVPLFRLSESDLCEFAAEAKQTAEDVGRALG
jgi:DNA-binding IclR family transcriptional regulator